MYDLLVHNARIHSVGVGGGVESATTLAVQDGRIAALGPPADAPTRERIDAKGKLLLPGLVDCHTHALYSGDRMAEHVLKMQGASYADIAKAGGGILSTVKAVRAASEQQLIEETLPRLEALRSEGVTTVEIKSGYGLDEVNELKMLRAIRGLRRHIRMDVTATFLGAHAVPAGRKREEYLSEVLDRMLPAVAGEKLADCVDIFVENIAYGVDDLKRLAERAAKLGLKLRAHTDQLSNLGATRTAAGLGALSCDHLEYSDEEDVTALARHGSVAVLLPGAFYFLRESRKPPVERLRRAGVPMAVATDLNPGSSPVASRLATGEEPGLRSVASLLAALHMAGMLFGLLPGELLPAVTRHAAQALGRADRIGSLAPGWDADFTLWDLPAPEFLGYQLGGMRPSSIFYKGQRT